MDLRIALASIIAVNILAWATPGPNMLAVISVTIERGRLLGIVTGLGLAFSSLVWSTLAVFGASSMLEAFPDFVMALKLVGAVYLGWLGVNSLKTAMSSASMEQAKHRSHEIHSVETLWAFQYGFLIGMTNPKALIFFGAIVTSFVPTTAPNWFLAVIVLLCGGLGISLHSVTATVFSTRTAVRTLERWQRPIAAVIGLMFCCFATIAYLAGIT